jgi:membrane-associated protein
MQEALQLLKHIVDPGWIIDHGGIWILLLIIFAETGLFVGFFLPGDSLLFVAGIYSSDLANGFLNQIGLPKIENSFIELGLLILIIWIAGVVGNVFGYYFGRKIGPAMFSWPDTKIFKKKYLVEANVFYDKYGGGAIVFARFLPFIRTFAPIVAGIVNMNSKKFMFYNVIGCFAWVVSMILAGHFLQTWVMNQFQFSLKDHLEVIVIGIIFITTAPVLWKLFFLKDKKEN